MADATVCHRGGPGVGARPPFHARGHSCGTWMPAASPLDPDSRVARLRRPRITPQRAERAVRGEAESGSEDSTERDVAVGESLSPPRRAQRLTHGNTLNLRGVPVTARRGEPR